MLSQDPSRQPETTAEEVSGQGTGEPISRSGDISMYPQLQEPYNSDNIGFTGTSQEAPYSGTGALGSSDEGLYERVSAWDDGLMWELFNIQPTIEWFDVGQEENATGF
ncbi:hypothetical protein BBP40_012105 [Aspergillus hancockii]|nr:hypothetical protein BBP40_012105 [Aspergillus hancockii]